MKEAEAGKVVIGVSGETSHGSGVINSPSDEMQFADTVFDWTGNRRVSLLKDRDGLHGMNKTGKFKFKDGDYVRLKDVCRLYEISVEDFINNMG